MSTVWREYGVIAVLLIVSVGGYLYLSRSEEDLLASVMDQFSQQLLSLVPDPGERSETEAVLADFRTRIQDREVEPEQLERFAAHVLNLQAGGGTLDGEEAEMVIKLAMSEPSALPVPDAPLPKAPSKASRAELAETARELYRMSTLFSEVAEAAPRDSSARTVAPVRFYSDRGIHVVIDERLRTRLDRNEALARAREEKRVEWQAQLAESVLADRGRRERIATAVSRVAHTAADSLGLAAAELQTLAHLRKLEANGLMTSAKLDSLTREIEKRLGHQFEVMLSRELEATIEQATRAAAAGVGEAVRMMVESSGNRVSSGTGASNRP